MDNGTRGRANRGDGNHGETDRQVQTRGRFSIPMEWLVLGCLLTPHPAIGGELRVWRDHSGKHEIKARFTALEDWMVVLEVEPDAASDGRQHDPLVTSLRNPASPVSAKNDARAPRTIRVSCERLTIEDQQHIAELMVPEVIDAGAVHLELLDAEQHVRLPLGSLPPTWDYEAIPLRVKSLKQSVDLEVVYASEVYLAESARQVRFASLRRFGQFPIPVQFEGGEAQVRVAVHLRQFQDVLVMALRPSLKVGGKTLDFAARSLAKEGRGLERSIVLDQRKLLMAQRDLKLLPREIQRAHQSLKPLSLPGAQFHNGQISLRIQELETGMQRAQRSLRSATRSLPLDTARLKQLQFILEVLQRHAGHIEAEFLVQRRCGEVVQPVLTARVGGRVTLGALPPTMERGP